MIIQTTCKTCDKTIKKKADRRNTSGNYFCNQSCAASFNNKGKQRNKPRGNCFLCQKTISSTRKYCSNCFNNREKRPKLVSAKQSVLSHYQKKKEMGIEYLGGCCKICKYDKCPQSLHFHHKNPDEKDFTISGRTISWERMKLELDKCILLCANCHGELHSNLISLVDRLGNDPSSTS